MHEHQVDVDDAVLRRLLRDVVPASAGMPLRRIASDGTINQVYRLGTELVVRVPLIEWGADDADRESAVLPLLAGRMPLRTPELVAVGPAAAGVPWAWTVLRWIPGRRIDPIGSPLQGADVDRLAAQLSALWALPPEGGPAALGGTPLDEMAEPTAAAIAAASHVLDAAAVDATWRRVLAATTDPDPRDAVFVHADPTPGNLISREGVLTAMIDWAASGAGDRALDLLSPWWLTDAAGRRRLRDALDVDEATWFRGRVYALRKAVYALGYYAQSNPGFHRDARFALAQVRNEA